MSKNSPDVKKKWVKQYGNTSRATHQGQHIKDNTYLLSLCYLPVNSFIVCTSLLQILQFNNSAGAGVTLPFGLTKIYKITVKVFYVKRTKALRDKPFTREDFESDHFDLQWH